MKLQLHRIRKGLRENALLYSTLERIEDVRHAGAVPVFSYFGKNWGDRLSPMIASMVSGKHAYLRRFQRGRSYFVIGSILEEAGLKSIIWGAGFISNDSIPRAAPARIFAVRGPLSRDKYLRAGINCPAIYGDPAILLPLYYQPQVTKKWRIGVVPHFVDKTSPILKEIAQAEEVKILDIEDETFAFVDQVASCDVIISSSLHGLICAESYGIPSVWVSMSNKVTGGSFKFDDYRLGIGGEKYRRIDLASGKLDLHSIASQATLFDVAHAQRALLDNSPFEVTQEKA